MKLYNYLKKVWRSLWNKKKQKPDFNILASDVAKFQSAFKHLGFTIKEASNAVKAFETVINYSGIDIKEASKNVRSSKIILNLAMQGFTGSQIQSIILNAEDLAANSDLTYEEAEVKAIEVINGFNEFEAKQRNKPQEDWETVRFYETLGIKGFKTPT